MAAPTYELRDYQGSAFPVQLAAPMADNDLSFILNGPFTNWPSGGANGLFALALDDGLPTVEKVLCSALDHSTGIATVATASGFNGRGYDGTSANAHVVQAAPAAQVRPCWTAQEAKEANAAVTYMLGTGGGTPTNGQAMVWDTGLNHPKWGAVAGVESISLFGIGHAFGGPPPPRLTGQFLMQCGYADLFSTDASGNVEIAYPESFPNGLVYTSAINADGGNIGIAHFYVEVIDSAGLGPSPQDSMLIECRVNNSTALVSTPVAISWLAIGF